MLVILLALPLALGAAFVARGMVAQKPDKTVTVIAPAKPTAQVLVAAHDLSVGDRITADMVVWREWPMEGVNTLFISKNGPAPAPADDKVKIVATEAEKKAGDVKVALFGDAAKTALEGQVVRSAILAGEPIVAAKLVKGGDSGVLAVTLTPGARAMSVPLSPETGAAGFIQPGDHVDVVQTRKMDIEGKGSEWVANTVMEERARHRHRRLHQGGLQGALHRRRHRHPGGLARTGRGHRPGAGAGPAHARPALLRRRLRPNGRGRDPSRPGRAGAGGAGVPLRRPARSDQGRPMSRMLTPRVSTPRALRLALTGAVAAGAAVAPALSSAQTPFPISPLRPSQTARPTSRVLAGAPSRVPAPVPVYAETTYAPQSAGYDTGPQTVRVDTGAGAARSLSLPRGKSAVIELPVDARDVSVSDPKVADVVLSTPRRIYVMGQSGGSTDAMFVDGMGRQILRLNIRVDQDISAVAETMARVMPGSAIRVEAANDSLILSGEASSAAEADKALRLASTFVDKTKIVNLIAVSGSEQVMLRVKIVEVNRTVIKQLGFNAGEVLGKLGGPQYSLLNAATYGVAGSFLGAFTGGYRYDSTTQPTSQSVYTDASGVQQISPAVQVDRDWKLATPKTGVAGANGVNQAQAMVQAFERAGLIRTLAEPNLTAISGESAKFLAGGEFPVPVSQDNNGRVSLEFKPYGVGLGFTPVVLGPGRISLKISTEVSELTSVGGFTLTSSSTSATGVTTSAPALSVPGLNVRRAETVVELPSGGSMMIGGLMQNQTKQTLDSLPGIMQIPILGSLFRSRDFQNNESELVIIVTPYLVKAGRPDQMQTPADGLVIANDIETNLLGRLNTGFNKPAKAIANKTYQGPFGYVVD